MPMISGWCLKTKLKNLLMIVSFLLTRSTLFYAITMTVCNTWRPIVRLDFSAGVQEQSSAVLLTILLTTNPTPPPAPPLSPKRNSYLAPKHF
jgi:hypothetical protein